MNKEITKMKKIFICILFFNLFACTPTQIYKSVTIEKNADGTEKRIETESVTQTIQDTRKLKLEKIKIQ